MRFYSGIPITVVANMQVMTVPTDVAARRRAEERARPESGSISCQARAGKQSSQDPAVRI